MILNVHVRNGSNPQTAPPGESKKREEEQMSFTGYPRADGSVGV